MRFSLTKSNDKEKLNLFYLLEAALGALIPLMVIFDRDSLASLFFNASFIVVAAHLAFHLLTQRVNSKSAFNLITCAVMIALAFACVAIVTRGGMSFNYIKKIIIFSAIFLLMFIYSEEKINAKTMKVIVAIFYVLAVVFIIFFFFMGGNTKTSGQQYSTAITMGFSNPNLTGMWLGTMVYFIAVAIGMTKKFIFKLISVAFIGILVYMIMVTESRNSLISLLIVLAVWLFYKLKPNKKMNTLVITVLIVLPLLFVGIYFAVLDTSLVDHLDFLVSEGKNLNSRVSIWNKALDAIKGVKLFTGDYYGVSNGDGDFQLHNVSLDLIASYGLIVYIICTTYMVRMLKIATQSNTKKAVNIGMLCFMGVWLFGLGEAGFLTGGSGMYLPACLLFVFAFLSTEEKLC